MEIPDTPGTEADPASFRSGYVALVGEPNVGKSTLLNALVGQKLSIVSNKPQTTRHQVLGILNGPDHQCIFLDTPGLIEPRYRLHEAMMAAVNRALDESDLIIFLVDPRNGKSAERTLEKRTLNRPAILVLNKMDLIRPEEALPVVDRLAQMHVFEAVVPISALKGFQVELLRHEIVSRLPPGPPYYPADLVTEQPERFFVAEIIREKIFERYRQEIPYSTQVNIVAFQEQANRKDLIDAEIVVERNTQKAILIGKGGAALKQLGTAARADIEALLERPVFLRLHVKVRDDWRDSPTYLRSYGYGS